jgi:hypothetical protein
MFTILGSSFDTTEFCSETLDDTRATPCPKMPPLEAVNAYRVSQHGSNHRLWTTHW